MHKNIESNSFKHVNVLSLDNQNFSIILQYISYHFINPQRVYPHNIDIQFNSDVVTKLKKNMIVISFSKYLLLLMIMVNWLFHVAGLRVLPSSLLSRNTYKNHNNRFTSLRCDQTHSSSTSTSSSDDRTNIDIFALGPRGALPTLGDTTRNASSFLRDIGSGTSRESAAEELRLSAERDQIQLDEIRIEQQMVSSIIDECILVCISIKYD